MRSIALIGAAGSGKSTVAAMLVERGYVRHALADPLKVQLGFIAHRQLRVIPPVGVFGIKPMSTGTAVFDSIRNIVDGSMGYDFEAFVRGGEDFTERQHDMDIKVRDYFVRWVNERKPHFRKALQYYGTETVRDLSVAMGQPQVPWVRVLLSEVTRDRERGLASVVDDCRFPDEVAAMIGENFLVVRIVRPGQQVAAPAHASEEHWRTLPCDIEVINDSGLDELALIVDELVQEAS